MIKDIPYVRTYHTTCKKNYIDFYDFSRDINVTDILRKKTIKNLRVIHGIAEKHLLRTVNKRMPQINIYKKYAK